MPVEWRLAFKECAEIEKSPAQFLHSQKCAIYLSKNQQYLKSNSPGQDEKYHEKLFRTLGDWPPPPPPGATPSAYHPMGPASAQPDKMTVAGVRGIIATAKKFAYGDGEAHVGDTVVKVDEYLIFNDPLIQYLKQYAVKAIEDEGMKTMYMSAGM